MSSSYLLSKLTSELGSSNSVYHFERLKSHGLLLTSYHNYTVNLLILSSKCVSAGYIILLVPNHL